MLSTEVVEYSNGDVALSGYLVVDEEWSGRRPGILIVHGGAGLDDHARYQAQRYAVLGYVAFACDMYGPDAVGDRERVLGCIDRLRSNPDAMLERGVAGLGVLRGSPYFNGRVAAVGFCFGGMAVLEFARRGMDLAGAVSIHGSLASTQRVERGSIRGKVLVCHGGRDPFVPLEQVTGFVEEMNEVGADCQVHIYGGAAHGFTHDVAHGGVGGTVYDESADRRSFAAARTFLAEIFEKGSD